MKAKGGLEWMERRHNTAVFDSVFIVSDNHACANHLSLIGVTGASFTTPKK